MSLILSDMKLSEVILHHYVLMPVIRRFDIKLGFGEKNIRQVCEEHQLDTELFLAVLNLYINHSYAIERPLTAAQVSATVDYLKKTNALMLQSQLPNVERHLQALMGNSFAHNKTIGLIHNFFAEIKKELLSAIEHDNSVRFPYINQLICKETTHIAPPAETQLSQDPMEEKIFDLRSMLMKYLTGEADQNLCYAVFFALYTLENDIRQYNKVCDELLNPAVAHLEKSC